MCGREEVDLGAERPDVGDPAPVDPETVLDDPLAHQLLGETADRGLDLALPLGELVGELGDDRTRGLRQCRVPLRFGDDRVGRAQQAGAGLLDPAPHVVLVVGEHREFDGLDRSSRGEVGVDQAPLEHDRVADPSLGRLEPLGEHLLGDLRRSLLVVLEGALGPSRLDHHDRDLRVVGVGERAAGDHQFEGRLVSLFERRVRYPFAVGRVGDAHGPDRTVEGDPRHHQRGRSGVDGEHVVWVDLIGTEDGPDDVHLVAEALRERRAERAVDQPVGEDRLIGGLALTAEERAGDLPCGVGPLLHVDGKREEVGSLAYRSCSRGGHQHDGVADPAEDRAVGQLRELARFESKCPLGSADRPGDGDGV